MNKEKQILELIKQKHSLGNNCEYSEYMRLDALITALEVTK